MVEFTDTPCSKSCLQKELLKKTKLSLAEADKMAVDAESAKYSQKTVTGV